MPLSFVVWRSLRFGLSIKEIERLTHNSERMRWLHKICLKASHLHYKSIFVTLKLENSMPSSNFYRTRVRSLAMLVTNSLTHWLTNSCLVNLIDVTLACEDANLKLVEVVTVADVDAEDHVGNSLLQIWEVTFGPKAKLLFRLWAQGLVKILKLKFVQHFAADVL